MSTTRGYVAAAAQPGLWTTPADGRRLWCHSAVFEPLDVPGYDVLAPLGGAGRTWKAIATSDGARVVLRRVYGGEQVQRRIRREAALWGSVSSAHLVAVRDVFAIEPDVTVVVSDYVPGGGLDMLLSRRGSLEDGEVVTLLVPLAQTLAAAHRRGLVHGRMSIGNVVFTEDGRPMLSDAALVSGDANGSAADVAALVALGHAALGDRRTSPVQTALASQVADAAELAAVVSDTASARPIAIRGTRAPTNEPRVEPVRSGRRRPLVVVAFCLAAALVGGVAWGHRNDASAGRLPAAVRATPSVSAAPTASAAATHALAASATPQRWQDVVQRLERARVREYTAALRRAGLRPVGLRIHLQSAQVLSAAGDHVVVHVVDGWARYELVDDKGRVVAHRAARHGTVKLLLRRT